GHDRGDAVLVHPVHGRKQLGGTILDLVRSRVDGGVVSSQENRRIPEPSIGPDELGPVHVLATIVTVYVEPARPAIGQDAVYEDERSGRRRVLIPDIVLAGG